MHKKKINIICYFIGTEFFQLFKKISLPSFIKSFENSIHHNSYTLEFSFATDPVHFNEVKQIDIINNYKISLYDSNSIIDFPNLYIIKNQNHINVWENLIRVSKCDYDFFLIPDNLYSNSFFESLMSNIDDYDFVINYPGYVTKESFFNEISLVNIFNKINENEINDNFIIDTFIGHAHPLNFSWINSNNDINNFHFELDISIEKNEIINFYNLAEHPILIKKSLAHFRNYKFNQELKNIKKNNFKLIKLRSISIDSIKNQFNMINYSSRYSCYKNIFKLLYVFKISQNFQDQYDIERFFSIDIKNKKILDFTVPKIKSSSFPYLLKKLQYIYVNDKEIHRDLWVILCKLKINYIHYDYLLTKIDHYYKNLIKNNSAKKIKLINTSCDYYIKKLSINYRIFLDKFSYKISILFKNNSKRYILFYLLYSINFTLIYKNKFFIKYILSPFNKMQFDDKAVTRTKNSYLEVISFYYTFLNSNYIPFGAKTLEFIGAEFNSNNLTKYNFKNKYFHDYSIINYSKEFKSSTDYQEKLLEDNLVEIYNYFFEYKY
jgi:hypothetical protein